MDDQNDGWVRGPALEIVRAVNGWRIGDEVEVDLHRWYEHRRWNKEPLRRHGGPFGVITSLINHEGPGPVVCFPDSGTWNTAHEFIIAWRPRRPNAKA